MGKRYYCNYCDKAMVATPSIVRTHNNGLVHQKLVQEHYQQFKDPETILAEESTKKPCIRFARGECQFGSICRFSHYTAEEINTLQQIVTTKNMKKDFAFPSFQDLFTKLLDERSNNLQECSLDGSTVMYDSNGVTHTFPWVYNTSFESYGDRLPPSLKKIEIKDFVNAGINYWG